MTNIVAEATKTVSQVGDFFTAANITLAAILVFIGYFFKFTSKIKPYTTITKDIEELKSTTKAISAQFQNNGGKSLKDQLDKLENTSLTILQRQRWILDNRDEPIFETDAKGNLTWANDAMIRLTDRLFKDLQNNNWINALCEKTRNEVNEGWYDAIENERNFEHNIIIIDSKNRAFGAKCVATRQDDGKYMGKLMNIKELEEGEKTC